MKKEQLDELLSKADSSYEAVVKAVAIKPKKADVKYQNALDPLEEYQVENHPVFDTTKRRDKQVKDKTGQTITKPVNRIGLAYESMIASRAAAFLCANPVIYQATPEGPAEEKMWEAFKRVNEANKLDFKNLTILETRMAETQVAEILYLDELAEDDDYWGKVDIKPKKEAGKIRLFLAQPSFGDTLYPVWSGQDNLLAIGREYKEKEGDKEIEHFDLYTAEFIYEGVKENGWTVNKVKNEIGKIPVVFHSQPDVEWAKVRSLIRRLEDIMSNFGESNDRTAFPMLLLMGKPTDIPQGVADKALQMENGAEAKYLVPDSAPEAIKTEIMELRQEIYSQTDTPDISFQNLKGMGTTSGFALKMMFMGAHLKAARHAGTFGEGIQRRVNLIKRMIATVDPSLKEGVSLEIKPTFDFFLPKDTAGIIDYLVSAVTVKIISQETAVAILQGVMGGDGVSEFEKILEEAKSASALNDQFA